MRAIAFGTLVVCLGMVSLPTVASAKPCADAAAVTAAQLAASAECDCAGATNRGDFVSCVAHVAQSRAAANLLPRECQSEVIACAVGSTCGTGNVICCHVLPSGQTTCRFKKDASGCDCLAPGDACGAAGSPGGSFTCGSTTTTTSAPTTTTGTPTTSTAAPTTSTAAPTTSTSPPTTSTSNAPPSTTLPTTTTSSTTAVVPTTSSTTTTLMGSPSGAFLDAR